MAVTAAGAGEFRLADFGIAMVSSVCCTVFGGFCQRLRRCRAGSK